MEGIKVGGNTVTFIRFADDLGSGSCNTEMSSRNHDSFAWYTQRILYENKHEENKGKLMRISKKKAKNYNTDRRWQTGASWTIRIVGKFGDRKTVAVRRKSEEELL